MGITKQNDVIDATLSVSIVCRRSKKLLNNPFETCLVTTVYKIKQKYSVYIIRSGLLISFY